jgi:cysteinyl-tRNA synthetase
MIDSGKMSKSLGNYISFDDVLAKHSPDAFRYFYISTHYRRPLNFTWNAMESSENTIKHLENTLDLIENAIKGPDTNIDYEEREEKLLKEVKIKKKSFIEAMDDDFNTPVALGNLHAISGAINDYLQKPANKGVIIEAASIYKELLSVLGLFEKRSIGGDELSEKLLKFITDLRQEQRHAKNYALADEIRDRLNELGIDIQDTPDGTTWKIS